MAKLRSLIKLEGTMDEMTFYKSADGYLVRTKGGVSKNRIMNDPAFARTRENGKEFGSIAVSGKLLRTALGAMIFRAKDNKVTRRLVKVMGQVKNLDSTSIRGDRNVGLGLNNPNATILLEDFDFNDRATLSSILNIRPKVLPSTGKISFDAFDPKGQLRFPDGATHFTMQAGFLRVNFLTEAYELTQSTKTVFSITLGVVTPVLTPTAVPTLVGKGFHVVLIEFFQEVNGVQYVLNNGSFNVLNLVKVS